MKPVTISVCMMVRNEEQVLLRALKSTVGLADEIVVIDTGSTDDTPRIALGFGARVIENGDRRHKAQCRNQAQDAATGDFVVILDADEIISDPTGFRAFLETTDAQAVYIRETFMEGDVQTLSFAQMRVWRRGVYEYRYRAHEVPLPVSGYWNDIVYTEFVFEHRPPGGRTWKRNHMLMLLLMDVEENPGAARPLYYLSRELMYLGAWQACIETTFEYLAVETTNHDKPDAFGNLAICYTSLGQKQMAPEWLLKAMALQPECRTWPGRLAEYYHSEGSHQLAAEYLQIALALPKKGGYVDEAWYGPHIYDLMARCLWYADRKAEGLTYARQACALNPDDQRLKTNLAWFEQD